jgi:putative oxidoreductase
VLSFELSGHGSFAAGSASEREERPMKARLAPHSDSIYAVLRIVVGFFFACHGAQKLFGFFGAMPPGVPFFVQYVGGTIEFVGGLLIMIGLFTSWAAFICSGMMAVAYFMAHQPNGLLPIENHGELAAAYAFLFLYIASRGSGPLAVQPD